MGGYYCDLCTTLEKPDRTSLSLSEFKFSVQISRQTDDLGLEKVGIYMRDKKVLSYLLMTCLHFLVAMGD